HILSSLSSNYTTTTSIYTLSLHDALPIFGKDEEKMGLHGSRTVQLTFEDMKVPAENRLGEEGEGFKIAMANLDVGRIGIAAQALDRKSTRLNSSHVKISYAVFCLKKKKNK